MPILDPEIETVRVILPRPQVIRLSDTEIAPGSFGGEFIDLTDVPNSYSGASLKIVRVNVGETGLEFSTGGGGTIASTLNLLKGDNAGNAISAGILASNVVVKASGATPTTLNEVIALLQTAGLCS